MARTHLTDSRQFQGSSQIHRVQCGPEGDEDQPNDVPCTLGMSRPMTAWLSACPILGLSTDIPFVVLGRARSKTAMFIT